MIVGDLFSSDKGNIGRIYWMVTRVTEINDSQKQDIRQKSISNMLNAALSNAMYNQYASNEMQSVISRGWKEANNQINMLENQTNIESDIFMIGDPGTIKRINEIESSPNFNGWVNPQLIEDIKRQG